jgi:arylformamidase
VSFRWVDVSIPLREGATVWPGDEPYRLKPQYRIADGKGSNVSSISMTTHAGTHVDAPWHFEDNGKRLHELDTDVFFGEALLMDLTHVDRITADSLGNAPLPPRVLFKTRNSEFPVNGPFRKDYVAVDVDAAKRLVEEGVRLVGVDYLSVAPYKQEGQDTHHILLRNDVLVVEGLVLRDMPAGIHRFTVLPLPLADADGSPCRAFVGLEE